jgi:hypothetical protein
MTLSLTDGDVGSTIWPEPFRAIYIVTFAQTLSMRLAVQNRARHRIVFEEALHTYFAISDISDIAISGLAGTTYIDKTDAARRKPQTTELVTITASTWIRQGNASSKIAVGGAVSSSRKAVPRRPWFGTPGPRKPPLWPISATLSGVAWPVSRPGISPATRRYLLRTASTRCRRQFP